jgi:sugar O-acyltransferase (sialic acid O-acetyltransferase NeuD family)
MNNVEKKEKLLILGASLFAEEIADVLSDFNQFELVGFVEGINPEKCHQPLFNLPVIWIDDVSKLDKTYKSICAVGSTKRKQFIQQALNLGLSFTSVIHPLAKISKATSVGEGCIVCAGAIIASHVNIGQHVITNRGCLIGHHTQVGNYVTISPGANIAGRVKIGDCSYIGMGAIVLDGISIGANSIVGAGAVVTRDVPDCVQVVGIPARVVKTITQ